MKNIHDSQACDTLVACLEATGDGICLTDLEGRIQRVNPAAEIMTGRTSGEAVGLACCEFLGCGDRSACPLTRPAQGKAWEEATCRGTRTDGSLLVLRTRTRLVFDAVGRPAGRVLLFSESSLQESLQRKMVVYERQASLGELATSLVHEVGNPVSVILGFARLLIQQEGDDPGGEVRERIFREAERCRRIVEQLLDYARSASSQNPRLVPLGLKGVVEDTLSLLSYRVRRRGVATEVVWDPETPFVLADPGEMKQVFLNLMINALDATGEGGRIRVSSHKRVREVTVGGDSLLNPRARVEERPWVEVRVENDGVGLGTANPEQFFVPFFTTKEGGGGLGLPVCRRIIDERGGGIRLENLPGKGACAVVELPGYRAGADDVP
ncbi:MAG: ATP-binding protein [Deferrisomatales bacterium]|nr:ATP-binding protein [Deferrisomatales bacterium]